MLGHASILGVLGISYPDGVLKSSGETGLPKGIASYHNGETGLPKGIASYHKSKTELPDGSISYTET
jgi:hypothetical protein